MHKETANKKGTCHLAAKSYLIKIGLCIAVLLFLFGVYYKWVTIPVYKHYYHAEHLLSNSGDIPAQASITVFDNKGFSIYNELPKDHGTGVKGFYSQMYRFTIPFLLIDSGEKHPVSQPIYTDKRIVDIIGLELYQKLCDYCIENNIDIEAYNRRGQLFYFCHLHNVKMHHDSGITNEGNTIYIHGTNDFAISSLEGSEDYRDYPFETDSCTKISKRLLKSNRFKTMQEGFVLKLKMDDWVDVGNKLTPSNTMVGTFMKTFMFKDITQAYYDITLQSKSIPDMNMSMEFNGAIDCKMQQYTYNSDKWKTNMSSVAMTNHFKFAPSYENGLVRVSFNDMENIQAWRLVVLGALSSIILSYLIQFSGGLLKLIRIRWLLCKKQRTK